MFVFKRILTFFFFSFKVRGLELLKIIFQVDLKPEDARKINSTSKYEFSRHLY